jgi:hypothetical protein
MRALIEARATEYADHPAGATGMLVKDYRGKNAEQMIWKFDGALVAQINDTLKQAAIEEGQWTGKRENKDSVGLSVTVQRLNAGRDRATVAKRAREAT